MNRPWPERTAGKRLVQDGLENQAIVVEGRWLQESLEMANRRDIVDRYLSKQHDGSHMAGALGVERRT